MPLDLSGWLKGIQLLSPQHPALPSGVRPVQQRWGGGRSEGWPLLSAHVFLGSLFAWNRSALPESALLLTGA